MENEPELIRQQMEQTRTALQEKLETLELQVTETVQGAAEAATETVQAVKEAVEETVETVKDTVEETVVSVQESLSLNKQVREHPWTMVLGATAIGFVGARLLSSGTKAAPAPQPPPAAEVPTAPREDDRRGGQHRSNGKQAVSAGDHHGFVSRIAGSYSEELAKIEGLAIGALVALIRDLLTSSVAPALAGQISNIADGFTVKLGGTPIKGPLIQPSVYSNSKEAAKDYRGFETKMTRPSF